MEAARIKSWGHLEKMEGVSAEFVEKVPGDDERRNTREKDYGMTGLNGGEC